MMTTTDRSRGHSATPVASSGVALSVLLFAALTAVIAVAAWRLGAWGALATGGAALVSLVVARRSGFAAGITSGSRARDDLHAQLVAVEAQLVRAQLSALRGPSAAHEEALSEALARAAAAETSLTEERAQHRAVHDFAEAALVDERRTAQSFREHAERTLAEERRQHRATVEQMQRAFDDERRQLRVATEEAERTTAADRTTHRSAVEQAERALAEERRQRKTLMERAETALADETKRRQFLQREVDRLTAEAALHRDHQNGALREVERVLAPWIEREKLLLDLSRLDGHKQNRSDLPALLDTIASKASFASVVLSDEAGLPVAASRGCRDPDGTAATSSLLFTLADRLAERGSPAPIAVLVHDEANETILHRLFRAGGGRYLLTATGRGRGVAPETLDPTLDSIERALLRESWAS